MHTGGTWLRLQMVTPKLQAGGRWLGMATGPAQDLRYGGDKIDRRRFHSGYMLTLKACKAAVGVFKTSPLDACLRVRRDFVVTNVAADFLAALLSPTHAVFALFFFHGLYETTCVMNCAHVLLGLSLAPMLHQKATEKLLQEGLETAERWPGSKVFPYPWIPDGVVILKELTACQRWASLSSSTFVQIDKTMPVEGASS